MSNRITRTRAFRPGMALFVLMIASRARADGFGADIPILAGILAQATDQVTRMTETLTTLKRTYDDARRVAGYADDAYRAFNQFKSFNAQLFRSEFSQSFDAAYPELGYFRSQASAAGPWARGSGELQHLVSVCLLGAAGCTEFKEAISLKQAREALATTFGAVPEGAHDLAAIDDEAAKSIAIGSAQEGRDVAARDVARQLLSQCGVDESGRITAASGDPGVLAQCQAAAASAQIAVLKQNAELSDQLSQMNRLQALQLALKSQDRKRELAEAQERRAFLLESANMAAHRPVPVQTEGFNLLEGAR